MGEGQNGAEKRDGERADIVVPIALAEHFRIRAVRGNSRRQRRSPHSCPSQTKVASPPVEVRTWCFLKWEREPWKKKEGKKNSENRKQPNSSCE